MNAKEMITKEIREKFENIFFDEVKYGIITALQLYESLNLKKLAQLVGRPETTTIRYVKSLLSEGLIDVDAEKTASSWGKFYKLSKAAKIIATEKDQETEDRHREVFVQLMDYLDKSEKEIRQMTVKEILAKKDLGNLGVAVRNSLAFKHNVENTITNEFISSLNELNQLITNKGKEYLEEHLDMEPSDIILYGTSLKLTKSKHLLQIYKLFSRLFSDLVELKKDLEKEVKDENISEEDVRIMNIQFFAGTMDFSFHLKEKKD